MTSGLVITTLARSLFPAALILVSRELVNTLVPLIAGAVIAPNRRCWWLAAGSGVTMLEVISNGVNLICKQRFTDELTMHISIAVMQHAVKLDLTFFESARSQDLLVRNLFRKRS